MYLFIFLFILTCLTAVCCSRPCGADQAETEGKQQGGDGICGRSWQECRPAAPHSCSSANQVCPLLLSLFPPLFFSPSHTHTRHNLTTNNFGAQLRIIWESAEEIQSSHLPGPPPPPPPLVTAPPDPPSSLSPFHPTLSPPFGPLPSFFLLLIRHLHLFFLLPVLLHLPHHCSKAGLLLLLLMELKVWVEGVARVVCGVSLTTSCKEVVFALARATGESPAVPEKLQLLFNLLKPSVCFNRSHWTLPSCTEAAIRRAPPGGR